MSLLSSVIQGINVGLLSWVVIPFSCGDVLEGSVCPENNLVDCTALSVKRVKDGDESSVGLPAKIRETSQKVVLVTGASSGIGKAVVEEFSRHSSYIVYFLRSIKNRRFCVPFV